MKSLILILTMLFITSCASIESRPLTWHHYGIQVDSESYDDKYIRGVSYLPSVMNQKIYAWASLSEYGHYFKLQVHNKSNKPISSNYFLDQFELFTKDGAKYILEPTGGIARYPEKKYINPQDAVWFSVNTPKGLKHEDDIAKIVIKLGYDARIVLKPKPSKGVQ